MKKRPARIREATQRGCGLAVFRVVLSVDGGDMAVWSSSITGTMFPQTGLACKDLRGSKGLAAVVCRRRSRRLPLAS